MRQILAYPVTKLIWVLILTALLATRVTGLADANSREGCMDQWLFNGVWRVQVTKVEPFMDGGRQTGWQVSEVWRNGSTQELSPNDSLLKDQVLELATGSISATATTSGTLSQNAVGFHSFAPAAQFTYTQVFVASSIDAANKPKAIDIVFDGAKLPSFKNRPQFTSSQYNFYFKLDCKASGAEAQAQGGSTQVAAREGCLHQWLSNGVWKMRATAISPDNDDAPNGPQIGWMITQDWVSLASRPITPGDTLVGDQYLITQSGNNVASSNSAGTSMNKAQLDFHTFAAGGSFTYQQRFRWSNVLTTDKPVRLLVTFDAAKENVREHMPHYETPANFRINLECSK